MQKRPPAARALDGTVAFLLNRVGFRTFAEFEKRLALEALTVSMWRVAVVLSAGGAWRIGDLAEPTSLEPSTASRAVKALEQLGHVERRRSSTDERVVSVTLTAAGRRLVERIMPVVEEIDRQILADLDAAEIRTLKQLLSRLGTRIELAEGAPTQRNGSHR